MKKRKLLFTLLALGLGCLTGGSGAMAQNGWESLYSQTQTSSADWTAITSGNTNGMTLGASGQTTYYYVTGSYNFGSATNYGVSGLKIQGTVYLYIPYGVTISCVGGHANGTTGAGAGIELAKYTPNNTLYIIGAGTVNATGGNAANGGNGGRGEDAFLDYDDYCLPGNGGDGGNGGGGAGAGIGTRGGTGGTGGSGATANKSVSEGTNLGVDGNYGTAGSTAGAMGTLYVASSVTVNATGGSKGSNGTGGGRGYNAAEDPGNQYAASGGGGGGAGGFGGAAVNIGTGGPGGGSGGGGAAGNSAWRANVTGGFYRVGAGGGSGGYNGDGSKAPDGVESLLTSPHNAEYKGGFDNDDNYDDDGLEASNTPATGGPGQEAGGESTEGTVNEGSKTYTITYNPIVTNVNGKTGNNLNSLTVTYSPGTPNIVLPANTEGYNWVLKVYGKSCAPNGTADSEFATATTAYYGGNGDEDSRTIVLNNVYGDLVFQEVATMLMMECSTSGENTNNDQEILEYYNYGYNVTARLQNRTLYRDNHWNTICLPFAMTPAQIAASPLAGATIVKLNESLSGFYKTKTQYEGIGYDHPVVLFYFDTVNKSTESLEAGQPYLVKWTEAYEHTADGNYVDNTAKGGSRHELDFPGVTITATQPGAWTGVATIGTGTVTFQGTFSLSADLDETDAAGNMNLVLGADDKLYHPSETINVGACRGYFKIPAAAVAAAPQFVMGFDDGETTGIRTIDITPEGWNNAPVIYNLSGQRLNALQKGVNIVNGKKVVVK